MGDKKLAIVVPVKNRQAYLEVFLEAIPAYLENVNRLHDFKIFVAEQVDDVPFNLSLSRNVGAPGSASATIDQRRSAPRRRRCRRPGGGRRGR